MNEHGLQAYDSVPFVVGQTREAQLAEDTPKFGQVLGLVQAAVQMNAERVVREGMSDEHKILDEYALNLLAEAADTLASMDVLADGFKRALGNAAEWLRRRPEGPHITEEEWATLRGQLLGLPQNPDEAGTYATRFIEALEEQSPTPFVR